MALKPTLYKLTLNLVDMNRDIYLTDKLTLVLHPSETETRMMVRLLAYALNHESDLAFSRGLSATDEPDLWTVQGDGAVHLWIEVGQASAERLRKGVSRADRVRLYAYGSETDIWWNKQGGALSELPKTEIYRFDPAGVDSLAALCSRNMELTLTISEEQIFLSDGEQQAEVSLSRLSQ
ncbi:YaeQ family protein [Neptuniibacter halophilus]|uniref:YaeQ family protein n=1 Tax=Neptuniibacter halophilus TaxID=651666 RepID=UPI0025730D7C|nr:YaeQ family protein [Neptuniibacter halophilus]